MKVVIADRDSKTVQHINRSLKSQMPGISLFSADSGQESIGTIKEGDTSLVIIGSELCDMSGFELIKRVRHFSEVPILFLSGDDSGQEIVKAYSMGIDRFMSKPIRQPMFIAYIRSLLTRVASNNPT